VVRHASAVVVVLGCGLLCVLAACGSVPDITFDTSDGGSSGSSGASGASGSSGGRCVPTGPEICDDGIDNDCNGRTDCADNACGAFTCVAAAPRDWQVVAYAEAAQPPSCPSGFGASADVKSAVTGGTAAACDCACGGSCSAGLAVAAGDASCSVSHALGVKSSCSSLVASGNTFDTGTNAKLVPPTTPVCAANPTVSIPALKDARVCAPPPRVGAGCSNGNVCVPRLGNTFSACVAKSGVNACPTGFALGHLAGTNPNDTRACSACTCDSTPCTAQAKLYNDGACTGAPDLTLNGSAAATCASVPGGISINIKGYTSTVSGGCVVATPPQLNGVLTFPDAQTVCCDRNPGG
jgi:hypothetical protein